MGKPNGLVQGTLDLLILKTVALERSEEHTSELQSRLHLVCRLLLEKKNNAIDSNDPHSTRRAMWTMKISRTGGCDSRCCILLAAFALANTAPMPSAYGSKTIAHTCV